MPSVLDRLSELRPVGHGTTRTVFDLGDGTVLKVPHNSAWAKFNLREAETWRRVADTEDGRHFAPVLACAEDGSWLIMSKAECDLFDVPNRREAYDGLEDLLDYLGDTYDVEDLHPGNWGMFSDGKVRAIDYAS